MYRIDILLDNKVHTDTCIEAFLMGSHLLYIECVYEKKEPSLSERKKKRPFIRQK